MITNAAFAAACADADEAIAMLTVAETALAKMHHNDPRRPAVTERLQHLRMKAIALVACIERAA